MISQVLLVFTQVAAVSPAGDVIRINQLGYLPDAPKVAVYCAATKRELSAFRVTDASGKTVLEARPQSAKPFGPCTTIYRLNFSSITRAGDYRISVGDVVSPVARVRTNAYAGAADTLLYYMREQRSGYNPLFRTVVH